MKKLSTLILTMALLAIFAGRGIAQPKVEGNRQPGVEVKQPKAGDPDSERTFAARYIQIVYCTTSLYQDFQPLLLVDKSVAFGRNCIWVLVLFFSLV